MVGVLKPRVKQLKFHSETYSKCPNAHKKFDWEQGTHICHDLCYTEETITDTSLGTDYKFTVDLQDLGIFLSLCYTEPEHIKILILT